MNLTDGQTHQVALYLVDYDNRSRTETAQVSDTGTGQVLNTQNVSSFQNGRWLVYDLSGNVTITLTNTGPVDAVASGLMFDAPAQAGTSAAATFVKLDTTTYGAWIGTYGTGGYSVAGGANDLPASVQLSESGGQDYTWANPAADPRAPQIGVGTQGRTAATYFSVGSFSLDLNLTDGQVHQVALYLLDFDALGRAQTVQVSSATTGALLNSQTVSNFQGGQYLVYDLTGHVKITFINQGPADAVLSGIFVDPKPLGPVNATYIRTDNSTQGTWTGTYGTQGYDVFGGGESLPSYASLTVNNAQFYQWAAINSDPTELQTSPGSTSRIAACDYSNAQSFSMNLNLTDGQTHQVALYLLDWDKQNRSEYVDVLNSTTGAFLSSSDFASNFAKGQYVIFDVTGDVTISVLNEGGLNEVVSGIFIDPAAQSTASFVRTDTTTQGAWNGAYGSGGYYVVGGQESAKFPLPLVEPNAPSNYSEYTYAANTSDPRALQSGRGSTGRVEAVDFASTSFSYNLNLTDGKTHQLAIYVADYDRQGRSETIQLTDVRTGLVLGTQFVSNFQNGKYLVWDVSGDLNVTFTQVSGQNAIVSGFFLD